jgi:hypothetical protein
MDNSADRIEMPKRPEKVTLTIPVDLKREARAKAILEGKNLSQVVRELLRLWITGAVELSISAEEEHLAQE